MTAQIPDTITIASRSYPLWSDPLFGLRSRQTPEIAFECNCTAMHRGYTARWEVIDNKLHLISVRGQMLVGQGSVIARLCPGQEPPIFAEWFSGSLIIPYGQYSLRKRSPYGYSFENHMQIAVRRGVCRKTYDNLGAFDDYSRPLSWSALKRLVVVAYLTLW